MSFFRQMFYKAFNNAFPVTTQLSQKKVFYNGNGGAQTMRLLFGDFLYVFIQS